MTTTREFEKDARFRFMPSMSDWDAGSNALTRMMRPAVMTGQPQLVFFESTGIPKTSDRTGTPVYQLSHHVWREWIRPNMQKTSPQDVEQRYKHFADCARYLSIWLEKADYHDLTLGPKVIRVAKDWGPLGNARRRAGKGGSIRG